MFERFDEHVRRSLFFARYEAGRSGSAAIGSEHLLLGLLREADPTMSTILAELGVELGTLRHELLGRSVANEQVSGAVDVPLADGTKRALAYAVREADGLGQTTIESTHLLLGLLSMRGSTAAQYLEASALEAIEIRHQLMLRSRETTAEEVEPAESCLDEFSRDITKLAAEGRFDPLIGRESELERVVQIVCRRTKNNPLLLGDAGVGKTAIVEGLADRIVRGAVPELLAGRRILALDLSLVVAGTKYRGQFEERLKSILAELKTCPEIIVFIDEIHSLIGTGSAEGSLDAANILKPALSRGEITCIGATTMREYRRHVEKDRALSRRFQVVDVREPTEDETIGILHGISDRYEAFHGVTYEEGAIVAAVQLASRYIADSAFPDKAIDLIDEAGARVKLSRVSSSSSLHQVQADIRRVVVEMKDAISGKRFEDAVRLREEELRLREELEKVERALAALPAEQTSVSRVDIEHVVSSWTGIPVTALSSDEAERLQRMETILRARVVGQDDAINAVARAIRRLESGSRCRADR